MKDFLYSVGAVAIAVIFLIGIFFVCFLAMPYLPELPPTPDPLDIYEEALNRCQSRETLSDEECQAAALREAYPIGD